MTEILSPQIIGNVGLYYTCYKLSRMGLNVMPTARNARGIDIVAYNADASRFVSIQVKTLRKRTHVPVGKKLDNIIGDFWVIVNDVTKEPCAYIMSPTEVKANVLQRDKGGRGDISYWLSLKDYDKDKFREAWDRIGAAAR